MESAGGIDPSGNVNRLAHHLPELLGCQCGLVSIPEARCCPLRVESEQRRCAGATQGHDVRAAIRELAASDQVPAVRAGLNLGAREVDDLRRAVRCLDRWRSARELGKTVSTT
jgi:hypothetical protein